MITVVNELQDLNAYSSMIFALVITTSCKEDGILSPKIYPKWVFSLPANVLPTNGNVILCNASQP